MLDIATAYNKYGFLGNDFLTWLWFIIETDQDITQIMASKEPISLDIGNSLVDLVLDLHAVFLNFQKKIVLAIKSLETPDSLSGASPLWRT